MALVGLMGSGKSAVGELLAHRCERPFIDTDHEIQIRTGLSIERMFDELGEPEFRKQEEECVKQATETKGAVIACGGGAVESDTALRALKAAGVVVYLSVDPKTAASRVADGSGRPLLRGRSAEAVLEELLMARSASYEKAADLVVDATAAKEQVVSSIIAGLGL